MALIKNTFDGAILDKDSDSRFIPSNKLIHAQNAFVTMAEGSNSGVIKNSLGNAKKSTYSTITGGKTIGSGKSLAKNKIYNFIKGTNHDYIYEYDSETYVCSIVAKSTTGTRLNFITGERITNVDVIVSGETGEDLLAFSGDSNPPRILNIERFKANYLSLGTDWFTEDEIMLIKAPPRFSPSLAPISSALESNFLEDRFISFCYRYKYNDNFHSAISSWSEYFFVPGVFNIDFETFENLGMVNQNNTVEISFNTGERDVIGVDLLYKLSNSHVIYVIDKYKKSEELWGDNATVSLQFNNSKVYSILPTNEYFRSFDNVPLQANSQTIIGNRLAYANYLENMDLVSSTGDKTEMKYSLSLVTNDIINNTLPTSNSDRTYTYSGSHTVTNGLLDINLSGVSFIKDSSIEIKFKIKTDGVPTTPINFIYDFTYYLPATYTNLSDFLANSGFKTAIETKLSTYFEFNGGVIMPATATSYVVTKGFSVINLGTDIGITFPVIEYITPTTPIYNYYQDNISISKFQNIGVASSLKSNRSYEICMLYMDKQGRKTTALTSQNNTLFIPNQYAENQNQIKVTIPTTQKPPAKADRYKFGIKFNTQGYEIVPINIFFIDGLFRWIKLDGENKNKIKDGDTIIVKRDGDGFLANPIKVKVLDLKSQPDNFISTSVTTSIKEPAGLYAKIKQNNFKMQYSNNEFKAYKHYTHTTSGNPISYLGDFTIVNDLGVTVNKPIKQGSVFSLTLSSNYAASDPFVKFEKTYVAQANYDNFLDFYNAQILPAGGVFYSTSHPDKVYDITLVRGTPTYTTVFGTTFLSAFTLGTSATDFYYLKIKGTETGAGSHSGYLDADATMRFVENIYIFETIPLDIDEGIYYETPETYTITGGVHQFTDHILTKTFNCYANGNGVESNKIRDAYNAKSLAIDFCPTAVSADDYKQTRRFADITYSGVYNSNTNVNGLGTFNLSLANFKEDIDKAYGAIINMKGKDSNLEVQQEDKWSKVLYGKDLLSNTDGTTNLIKVEYVLGQQQMYSGEYGISKDTNSVDYYGLTTYATDIKRGVVLKLSNNGLFEISSQGMTYYFKKLFRDNTINEVIGRYDQHHGVYFLNVKYNSGSYVTLVYSDSANGWLSLATFNPESMISINGKFLSFYNGDIYEHNQNTGRNVFYGTEYDSLFTFNFSQEPSMRKTYKTLEIEGTLPLDITLTTDLDDGFIKPTDFTKQEGVYKANTKVSNNTIDTSLLSCQGIGNCLVSGLILRFEFELDSSISVGDSVININKQLVGTILSKTSNSLTLDTINNITNGDFVMSAKPQSANTSGLCGYYMGVTASFRSQDKQSIFAINSEVVKSYN